jgi:hypothetical protein
VQYKRLNWGGFLTNGDAADKSSPRRCRNSPIPDRKIGSRGGGEGVAGMSVGRKR